MPQAAVRSRLTFLTVVAVTLSTPPLSTDLSSQAPAPQATLYLYKHPQLSTAIVGDFTGDGIADLSSGRYTARGRSDGTFGTPFIAGPEGGLPLAAGDLTRDGRLDLLMTANGWLGDPTQSTYILPGRGDGTFASPRPGVYGETEFAVVTDLDGDGVLDVAINGETEFEGGSIKIFNGDTEASFALVGTYPGNPVRGVAADLNRDGRVDLAFANATHSVTILINQGNISFAASEILLGDNQIFDISAASLGASDEHVDLVVVTDAETGPVVVLSGNGDGTFAPPQRFNAGLKRPVAVTVSDFTRDGFADIAVGNHSADPDQIFGLQMWDSVTILKGNGTGGAFGTPTTFTLGTVNQSDEPYANGLRRLRAHDLNRDGNVDLVGSPGFVMLNAPVQTNRAPSAFAGVDRTQPSGQPIYLRGEGYDPDGHWLTWRWTNSSGAVVGTLPYVAPNGTTPAAPGTYTYTLTVSDGFGTTGSDTVTVVVKPTSTAAVTVNSPYAGETVSIFSPYRIEWDAEGTSTRFEVAYSWNAGRNWMPINECASLPGTARECIWQEPGPLADQGLIRVIATYGGGQQWIAYSPLFQVVAGPRTSLPAGWEHRDIGTVTPAGNATFDGTTYSVSGAGADIWDRNDAFHFAFTRVSGDVTIEARVTGITNINQWTKAGIMIRETSFPTSRHASLFATPTTAKGLAFQRRWYTDDVTTHTAGPAVAPPVWLRLERQGNTFIASYRMTASGPWTVIGSDVFEATREVLVGLAVSSHVNGRLATATFDHVSVYGPASGSLPPGWARMDVGAPGAVGSTTWDGNTFAIKGSGADIWGSVDAFHFAYMTQTGSQENHLELTARVASVQNVDPWTKAGLMMRGGTDSNDAHASLFVTPGKGVAFQRRRANGQISIHTAGPATTAPIWLKLVIHFDGVSAFYRKDITDPWTFIARDEVAIGDTIYGGLAVSSHRDGTLATANFDNVSARPPFYYGDDDIGAVGIPGSTTDDHARVTMTASGADIWGTADAFRFHYSDAARFGLSARVVSVQNVHPWTKAGVMLRGSLSPSAPHVMLVASAGKGIALQYRSSQGQFSEQALAIPGTAPVWLRLRRGGGFIYAESSFDGTSWRALYTLSDLLGPSPVGGLVLTSHDNGRLATAVFDDVTELLP